MKALLIALVLAMPCIAHAGRGTGHAGGMGANGAPGSTSAGVAAAQSHGTAAGGSSGNGGSYWQPNPHASLVDGYQPWPESEMRQFQKP